MRYRRETRIGHEACYIVGLYCTHPYRDRRPFSNPVFEPSSRSISRLLWRFVRIGVYVLLAGIVLFFALTRTQVGRDGLRRQLQSTFNERFAGSLQIGSLQGTLLNELIVTDVSLRDPKGNLVATIDSAYTQPQWTDLLTANLSVSALTVYRPHLRLHREADGKWNLRSALRRLSPSSSDTRPTITLPHLAVREGRITTTRDGDAPTSVQNRWVFDYTRSEIDQVTAEASLEWTPGNRRVNLDSLSLRLPEQDLHLQSGQGEMYRERARWTLIGLGLRFGNTRLSAKGTLQPDPSDSTRTVGDLQIADSQIDHDELQRLIPRLPLRNTVTVEGRVGGSLEQLVVNELTVAHDQSAVRMEGTAFGLPDSLNLEAQLLQSSLRPADVKDVWPTAPTNRLKKIGAVQLSAGIDGIVEWRDQPKTSFNLKGTFSAQGRPGTVRGSLDVSQSATAPLQYTGTFRADSLNLAPFTNRPRLSTRLTGRATIDGRGTTFSTAESTVNVTLSPSRIDGRQLSSAGLQLTASDRSVRGTLTLEQPFGSQISARGKFDASGSTPLYNLAITTQNFDLDDAHRALPSTRLNATFTSQGRGTTWNTLNGSARLKVDTSLVRRSGSTAFLPPHQASLDVRTTPSDSTRIRLDGTIASATLTASHIGPPLWRSGQFWIASLRRAVDRQFTSHVSTGPERTTASLVPDSLRTLAQNARTRASQKDRIHLRSSLDVHRMDLLRRWWPGALTEAHGLHARTTLTLSPDTLHTSGTITADRLRFQRRRVDTLDTTFELYAPFRSDLSSALTASLTGRADTIQFGKRTLTNPSVNFSLAKGSGTLEGRANGFGQVGPFDLSSDVALGAGHTQFTIRDLYVGAGQNAWISQTSSVVSVHSDAVVFDSLDVESPRPLTKGTQRIQLDGTVSSTASDTLYAEMNDVLLYPIVQLTSMSRPLGGRLNGKVAYTGGRTQPQIQGDFEVHRLSFDRRILGTLQVQSRLTPRSPDLLVDADLLPEGPALDSLSGPPLVPQGPQALEENRLQIDGRVRLPGWSASRNEDEPKPDQLDLNVDVDRADLFFFKYIFDENLAKANGFTSGTIHVGGRFRHPLFDAQLSVKDARFTLPEFGLDYTASGPVDVDRKGIHLRDLRVSDGDGDATVRGSLLFNEYEYFSFDLSAELDKLTIIDVANAQDLPFYGTIRASGPASLTGPLPNAKLRSEGARTTPNSELFIPVSEGGVDQGSGYIIFADSTGQVPNLQDITRRDNILSDRPAGEPSFLEGLDIDINVLAPEESTVNLVFDPVVGDVVTAIGSGRVQLQRQGGEFFVYGNFNVQDGTYLFTAGEVFVRRFNISDGTLTWDGPPTNAQLDIQAEYRTRASTRGLGLTGSDDGDRIPVRVLLDIGGRVSTPQVELSLARVRDERNSFLGSETLDAILNQPDRTTEYATSVLLTNTFLLTTESIQGQTAGGSTSGGNLTTAGNQLAFNSVSQLVASQLNRYLGAALPNVDLNLGLQGRNANDLDVIYGVALRLLNERLVIRGEGVYTGNDPDQTEARGPQGEFVVELRLSNRVSVEAFYRRTGDEFTQNQTLTSSTGAGLSYQTEFATWRELFSRVFGWLVPNDKNSKQDESETAPEPTPAPLTREDNEESAPTDPDDPNDR